MAVIPLTWNQTEYPILWNNNPYIWNAVEIEIIQEIEARINGGMAPDIAVNKLKPKKKKVLIKLIARIKGEDYNIEKYKNNNIKISANDINLLIQNNVLNIQVNKMQNV